MTERLKRIAERIERVDRAKRSLALVGIAKPLSHQIDKEIRRLDKANEMAARGCLRELA